ncbi:MAG TPA: type II toxin-antitoxin system HicA family toxin [Methylococcus sp.]|nr:type II toxin-antitoxin system HicA family toxin [Methylococcus sp.]
MTRLPRNLSGSELIAALKRIGYQISRQTGSHIRLSCEYPELHHITVPNHDPLRIGTLAAILADVARHHGLSRDALLEKLFS